MGKGVGFPLAAAVDDEFDDVWDCNLPGPEANAKGGGSGIGDGADVEDAVVEPRVWGFGILKFPGSGGGGGPKIINGQ